MLNPIVTSVVLSALAKADKDKVIGAAAAVADIVARGEGHPTLRRAASLASQALNAASSNRQDS